MGMQFSQANAANYSDGAGHSLHSGNRDMGSAKGLTALAGWAGVEQSRKPTRYDKTYKQNGRLTHEEWDSQSKHGEYSLVSRSLHGEGQRQRRQHRPDQGRGREFEPRRLEALKNQG